MRGYFGIGAEGITKPSNVGSLFRSAHAFGAGFVFTVGANYEKRKGRKIDTSNAVDQVPFYAFPDIPSMLLPKGCRLVGIELTDEAIELPSFRHPSKAAYILGPERGSLSPAMLERCDFVVKIPTKFCINVSIAGAVMMYDRMTSMGRFAARPVKAGGPTEPVPEHKHGGVFFRTARRFQETPPLDD